MSHNNVFRMRSKRFDLNFRFQLPIEILRRRLIDVKTRGNLSMNQLIIMQIHSINICHFKSHVFAVIQRLLLYFSLFMAK
jgi:hypothetical protein